MNILEVNNISKRYGKKTVLDNVSLEFKEGITALLGPNGAGKSTLLNIMCALIKADSGSVTYRGKNIKTLKGEYFEKISVQFQNQPMHKNYNAAEYLTFCGKLKGLSQKEITEQGEYLLQLFGLLDCGKKKIGAFSGGMRQRLALCGTFLGNPEIVILDEPSVGLDISEREELKNHLCKLKRKCLIIISTHIVSDIENIADNIILLGDGQVRHCGTQQELLGKIPGRVWEIPQDSSRRELSDVYHTEGKTLCISTEKPTEDSVLKTADLTDVYFSVFNKR